MAGAKSRSRVVALPRAASEVPSHRVGRIVGWSDTEGPLVDFDGNVDGPIAARSVVVLDEMLVRRAIDAGREVLLAFDGGRVDRPIMVGWIEVPGLCSGSTAVTPNAPSGQHAAHLGGRPYGALEDTTVDGRRVVLEALDEIVLRCGQGSITVRRNGRVLIRGVYVETEAQGINRIKGGAVKIN